MTFRLIDRARRLFRRAAAAPTKPGKRWVEPLEDRSVPASLTFALPGGVYGLATFTMPTDGVDPGQASQAIALTDLTVRAGDQTATDDDFSGTPTANFASGIFQGISVAVVDSIPSQFSAVTIENNQVTATDGDTNPIAEVLYDPADTQQTFVMSDGTVGTLSYDDPSGSVDDSQASQSLALSNFTLTLAGQVLTPANASFTTSPTMQFAYGEMTGITFAIDTSGISDFPYAGVSAEGMTLSAVDDNNETAVAPMAPKKGTVTLDFNLVKGKKTGAGIIDAGTLTVKVTLQSGTVITATVNFSSGISTATLAESIAAELEDQGLASATANGDRVSFTGLQNDPIKSVEVSITNNSGPGWSAGGTIPVTVKTIPVTVN